MLEQPLQARALPVYRDKWIQIIGIPLITVFSYYLTYNNIQFNWWLVYEFCSDVVKIFLVWQVLRFVITRLDRYHPWEHHLVKRLAIQIPLTCIAGLIALTALVFTDYAFIRPYPLEHYFSLDLIIALIFLLLGNAIYVSLYYYDVYLRSITEKQALARQLQEEHTFANEHLVVKMGKRDIVVPFRIYFACILKRKKLLC
ncbi:hypothetical protein GXP67_07630 [Rhodocytophaga rosea]|uniref:Uncharacterized protein n=1 Tax=Rhodocytophaga rosea TaxID=2704465 RepID=A0A6C0GEZ5_9BACT|nr:hypothetical protein [Rhodocytophaga rosea]QHT66536.1 hypothetical protein GXP67_07630 [Rhodocytophaga rosea]